MIMLSRISDASSSVHCREPTGDLSVLLQPTGACCMFGGQPAVLPLGTCTNTGHRNVILFTLGGLLRKEIIGDRVPLAA